MRPGAMGQAYARHPEQGPDAIEERASRGREAFGSLSWSARGEEKVDFKQAGSEPAAAIARELLCSVVSRPRASQALLDPRQERLADLTAVMSVFPAERACFLVLHDDRVLVEEALAARRHFEIRDVSADFCRDAGGIFHGRAHGAGCLLPALRAAQSDPRRARRCICQVRHGAAAKDMARERRIFGAAGEYAYGVERLRDELETRAVDAAKARLVADRPAVRGGPYRRTAGLRAERE